MDLINSLADSVVPGGGEIVSFISNLFGSRPNPNDWKGWNVQDVRNGHYDNGGASIMAWIINDGDSANNEAGNILSAIKNLYNGDLTFLTKKSGPLPGSPGPITPAQLRRKMIVGGYSSIADQLANQLQKTYDLQQQKNAAVNTTRSGVEKMTLTPENTGDKGNNTMLFIGLGIATIIIVALIVTRSKK
jgi:LPXTG-motif cell wall-anchored protein